MKKILTVIISIFIILPVVSIAKNGGDPSKSDKLTNQSKELDRQIKNINIKVNAALKEYKLINNDNIRVLPFQIRYNVGKDYIEIEKHLFIKSKLYKNKIVGIKKKKIILYAAGNNLSKVVTEIYEKNFDSQESMMIVVEDPSPLDENTSDITFTHKKDLYYLRDKNGKFIIKADGKRKLKGTVLLDKKLLNKVQNSTIFPVRNNIKRDFLVPNITNFYNILIFIGESYSKSQKDSDQDMSDFLQKSTSY